MKYIIITEESVHELTSTVQGYINTGWVLQGGVCVCEVYKQVKYYQAIIKIG